MYISRIMDFFFPIRKSYICLSCQFPFSERINMGVQFRGRDAARGFSKLKKRGKIFQQDCFANLRKNLFINELYFVSRRLNIFSKKYRPMLTCADCAD